MYILLHRRNTFYNISIQAIPSLFLLLLPFPSALHIFSFSFPYIFPFSFPSPPPPSPIELSKAAAAIEIQFNGGDLIYLGCTVGWDDYIFDLLGNGYA